MTRTVHRCVDPVAARSRVCGRSPVKIVGSNPARGKDVCCECCVLTGLRRADPSSREVLLTMVCLCVSSKTQQ